MFQGAKVGDRVWSIQGGWTEIIGIGNTARAYPLLTTHGVYTIDGKCNKEDLLPSLYWDEIKIVPPQKPKKKGKKRVEGYLYKTITPGLGPEYFFFLNDSDKSYSVFPATVEYEVEE